MDEIWKDIIGYEGLYQVSNFGRVKSLSRTVNAYPRGHKANRVIRDRILKSNHIKNRYDIVALRKNNKTKTFAVHNLVANHFLPNPNNLPEINHIDENKQNNRVDNLEWCTHKHNMNSGTVSQRIGNGNRGKIRAPEQIQRYRNSKKLWWKNKKETLKNV